MPFENFDFTDFWDDCDYSREEYISEPPADELIAEIEKELGYKLPESYIWLMRRHNGGIPVNTCYPTDEPTSWADDHIAISGILGIGRDKSNSLCGEFGSRFMIDEWEYPDIGVAVCDCPSAGHDMVFLDYSACGPQGEPRVVHIDQECGYDITFLADNFETFIRGLVNEDVYDTSEEDREMDLEKVRTAAFSPLLSDLCDKCGAPAETEQWIRGISEEIVEEKYGFFLHADERSMLLYDIQFWLYTHVYPDTAEEEYLAVYPQILALNGPFSTGGYAPSFITEWLSQRKEEGWITETDGTISLTPAAQKILAEKRASYSAK